MPPSAAGTCWMCRRDRGSSPRQRPRRRLRQRPGQPSPWSLRVLRDAVFQRANAVDLDAHDVAGLEIPRRIKTDADTDRRAGGDDVAGLQRDALRQRRDDGRDVEDEQRYAGILAQILVDETPDTSGRQIEFIPG